MPIDPKRPLITKVTFTNGTPGPKIFMYEDEPGTYYDAHGTEVPAVIAKAAGYDVEAMEQRRALYSERKRMMDRYDELVAPKPPRRVLEVRPGGHQLIAIDDDLVHIEDRFGQRITSSPLSQHYGRLWLDDIDPVEGSGKASPMTGGNIALVSKEYEAEVPVEPEQEPMSFPSKAERDAMTEHEEPADTPKEPAAKKK